MEIKTPNLSSWKRVLQHRFTADRVDNAHFHGYVTRFFIDKVSEPRIKQDGQRRWVLAGNDTLWVQYFPDRSCYTIRTNLDSTRTVQQWYIDICKPYELDAQGVPTYVDLDLDIVVWPDGEVELWDADELEQSLQDGAISRDDYELAWAEAKKLMEELKAGRLVLPKSDAELPIWIETTAVNNHNS